MIPMRKIPRLPQELIIEIFLWLPVISLMRFRCVSKFFDALVLDSDFIHVHHLRSMTRDGGTKFLMWKTENLYVVDLNENGNISRWKFDCHNRYSNGPCVNGLYCIWQSDMEPVIIFNPSTRKMIVLPYQRKYYRLVEPIYYYSLGYEPVEKKYKVLMQVHYSHNHARNYIFTLSIDKSWRKIKGISDYFPNFHIKPCSIEGVIYKMNHLEDSIVAFDVRAENFRVIRLNDAIRKNIYDYDFIEVKGKIALLHYCGGFTGQKDLWILENSEKKEWKSHSIHIPSQWRGVEDITEPIYCPPEGFYYCRNGEIICITMKNSILFCNFYDLQKNSWRHLEIHGAPTNNGIYAINFYVESLYLC